MKSATLYIGLVICIVSGILFPQWVIEGRFDGELIPMIGCGIAIYGGFIATAYYILDK